MTLINDGHVEDGLYANGHNKGYYGLFCHREKGSLL
jgi:hypothetical protein